MDVEYRQRTIEQITNALTSRSEILDAYLFGSLARGDAQERSDVDVAVFVDPDTLATPRSHGFGYAAELGAELQQALARSDVDLIILNHATPSLYHAVLRDGERVISRDLRATTRREGYALSRYCDDLPRLRHVEAIGRARVKAGLFGT